MVKVRITLMEVKPWLALAMFHRGHRFGKNSPSHIDYLESGLSHLAYTPIM